MRNSKLWLILPLAVWTLAVPLVVSAEDGDGSASDGPQLEDRLLLEQGKLTDTYRRFKSELLKLAELTRKEDPARAALLERAVAESSKRGIHDQLGDILDLLNSGLLRDIDDVSSRQAEVEQDLQSLLKLLLTENRADRQRSERDRIRNYIKGINRAINRQREISSNAKRGGDIDRLGKRQGRLADQTGDIAKDIQDNEESGEAESGEEEPGDGDDKAEASDDAKAGEKSDSSDPSSGDKSASGEPSDGKSSDSEAGDEEASDAKSGDEKSSEETDSKETDGESDDAKSGSESKKSESGEPTDGESKPSEGSEPSDGKPSSGDSKPGESSPSGKGSPSQPSQGQSGDPSQGKPSESPQSESFPARERVEAAAEKMREAQDKFEQSKRDEAAKPQEEALAELEKAKRELEEILRQMREEEMEKTLAMLEGRFRKMLEMQKAVYDATVKLDEKPAEERDRADEIEADRVARKEVKIIGEVDKAMVLLREDGTAVALPEAVMQLREDMEMVAERLTDAKVGKLTQDVESDIIEALQEIVEALAKARKDLKEGNKPPPPPGMPMGGEPGEPPLVDILAELKMIRALQMRVNRRTAQYKEMIDTEEVTAEWLEPTIRRLAEREQRIHRVTRDIVLGKNK